MWHVVHPWVPSLSCSPPALRGSDATLRAPLQASSPALVLFTARLIGYVSCSKPLTAISPRSPGFSDKKMVFRDHGLGARTVWVLGVPVATRLPLACAVSVETDLGKVPIFKRKKT